MPKHNHLSSNLVMNESISGLKLYSLNDYYFRQANFYLL